LSSLVDQVSPVFSGVDDVAELLEGSRDVRHVKDDPVDGGVLDPLSELYQEIRQATSHFRILTVSGLPEKSVEIVAGFEDLRPGLSLEVVCDLESELEEMH